MSLNITDQPQEHSPAYNPMMYVVESTNATARNFFVRCKVEYFKEPDGYTQIGKNVDLFCLPGTDYIIFSPHLLLKNYVADDLDILMGTSTTGQPSRIGEQYRIKFQEWMGTIPQASGTEITNTAYVWNGALETKHFPAYNENDFVINSTQLARFLTPVDEVSVRDIDTYMLSFMSYTTGSTALATKVRVEKFDYTNTSLGITDVTISSIEADYINKFQSVRIGPAQVGVASNVKYYDVWAASASNTQRTEKFRFNIDRECSAYEVHSVYFLNTYGGIDMLNFPLVSREMITIDRAMYNRPVGEVNTDKEWVVNSYDRERSVFNTKITHKNTYNSGYLDNTQARLFKDLVTSPKIWVYDGIWISMHTEKSDYEVKKIVNDGLIQEELVLIESLTSVR